MPDTDKFVSGGKDIKSEVFRPPGTPPASGAGVIIIVHGSDGMAEPWGTMIRDYANELANRGFVAVIPRYFQRTWNSEPTRDEVFAAMQSHRDEWQATIADSITHAKTKIAGIDASRVGLLGFSLGGHLCLRLWTTPKVLVEFYAPTSFPQLGKMGPSGPIATHVQIHHGKEDGVVPVSDAEFVLAELKSHIPAPEPWFYDRAGHGFIGPTKGGPRLGGTDLDNAKANEESRKKTLTFFQTHL